jgi:hypothetical protein
MSKNILQRTINLNSQEAFVYTFSQYPETSFLTQRLSSIRSSSALNIFTNPFGKTTGQWRALNLKVDPTNGYGSEEKGAVLSFGFSKESNTTPVSIACGFTLGQPPLHARHVSTVTRSICYGFILNPFPVDPGIDDLYILHENVITKLSNVPYDSLSIEIKGSVVTYKASGLVLATLTMSNISMVLYVVGCLGFGGNQITNLSLSGGSSTSFTPPDFQKELYIPCLGLTSFEQNSISTQTPIGSQKTIANSEVNSNSFGTITNIQVRSSSGKSFTVHYPNGTTKTFNTTSLEPFQSVHQEDIYSFSPFTIKITFNSLSDLKGLIVANPLISSELSLDQSLNYLTNLEVIEVRSSFSSTFNAFHPTIGENLPLPTPTSKLKLANIEGSYELKEHDFSRQQELTNLFISTPFNSSTFPKIASARNLTYFEVESSLDNWFLSNFRNIFTKPRTPNSHGVIRNSVGNSSGLSSTNTQELAIAQQSYMLMYGLSEVDRDNTTYFSPQSGSGFGITSQWQRKQIDVDGQTIFLRDYIFEGITTNSISGQQEIVFYVHTSVSNPGINQLFCIRTSGHINTNTLNHQLRRIASIDTEQVIKVISGKNIEYRKYKIVTKKTKTHIDIDGVTIINNNSSQSNTVAITRSGDSGNVFLGVEIGDTVWDRTASNTLTHQNLDYKPAIVIRKEDDGKRIIVLQSSGGSLGTSIQTGTRNIRFGWEWSLLTDPIINITTYPTDIRANDTATFTTTTSGTTTDVFTDTRAAREYLVSVSGS